MKTIALLVLILSCFSAEEDADKKLPKATESIIAKLNSTRAKAVADAIKELQKVQGELTKKGDLDGAVATKKYIEGLQGPISDVNTSFLGEKAVPLFVKAEWGVEGNWFDVTSDIMSLVSKDTLDIPSLNHVEHGLISKYGDPVFGVHKMIKFTFHDKTAKSFFDNAVIHLPITIKK